MNPEIHVTLRLGLLYIHAYYAKLSAIYHLPASDVDNNSQCRLDSCTLEKGVAPTLAVCNRKLLPHMRVKFQIDFGPICHSCFISYKNCLSVYLRKIFISLFLTHFYWYGNLCSFFDWSSPAKRRVGRPSMKSKENNHCVISPSKAKSGNMLRKSIDGVWTPPSKVIPVVESSR